MQEFLFADFSIFGDRDGVQGEDRDGGKEDGFSVVVVGREEEGIDDQEKLQRQHNGPEEVFHTHHQ